MIRLLRDSHRVALALLIGCLVPLMTVWVWKAGRRALDLDELEHLNAAFFLSQGETIYGTFFENHGPVLSYLLQPIVRATAAPLPMILGSRAVILVLTLTTVVLVGRLCWRASCALEPESSRARRLVAPLSAAALLLSQTFFFQRGIEIRPDVPAMLLLVLAIFALQRAVASGRLGTWTLAGVLLGLSGIATPKVIYAATGAVLAALVAAIRIGRRSSMVGAAAGLGLGAALVGAAFAGFLAWQGTVDGFIADFLVTNRRMVIETPDVFRWNLLRLTLTVNTVFWALVLAGGLHVWARRRTLPPALAELVLGVVVGGLAGFLHIQAPLPQVFLTFLPMAAVAGGLAVAAAVRAWGTTPMRTVVVIGPLIALATMPPIYSLRKQLGSMDRQIRVIDEVRELTTPGDRVFDCWTGLYLTRLPAYRYFFLNSDVQRVLGAERLARDLPAVIADPATKVILVDLKYFPRLPAPVLRQIDDAFAVFMRHHSGVTVMVRK